MVSSYSLWLESVSDFGFRISGFLLRLLLVVLATISPIARASGDELFVSTQGSDSNPGTSAEPLRTITGAYALANAGTTIIVLPGVYTDYTSAWGLRLFKSGTPFDPIVLKSQVRRGAIIDGQNAVDRNRGLYIEGDYHVIDGFDIRNGPNGGITIYGNGNRIVNNQIHHNGNIASFGLDGQDGIYSSWDSRDNSYASNFIHDNGRPGSNLDHGLYLCGRNETVFNNILLRNAASGLQIAGYTTVENMKVYNNVIAWNGTDGIILWMLLNGVEIMNNIVYRNGRFGLHSFDAHGGGVVLDRNLWHGNGAGNYNFSGGGSDYTYTLGATFGSDPLFVDGASASFNPHLGAGSPALKTGLNLYGAFPSENDGPVGPDAGAWNLGAYLYGAANTPPTISSVADRAIVASGSTGPISFRISDAQTSGSNLTVSVTSSNPNLVPRAGIKLDAKDDRWSLSITPARGGSGTATISLEVSDGQDSASTNFRLTVRPLRASEAGPPTLQVSHQNGRMRLRWTATRESYILQSKPVASLADYWMDVTNAPTLVGGHYLVLHPVSEAGRLYRLRRQNTPVPPK